MIQALLPANLGAGAIGLSASDACVVASDADQRVRYGVVRL